MVVRCFLFGPTWIGATVLPIVVRFSGQVFSRVVRFEWGYLTARILIGKRILAIVVRLVRFFKCRESPKREIGFCEV
jgi:hypothetical protein